MNEPSSTIKAVGYAGFIASTFLLAVKILWPDVYAQIPAEYQGYLVTAIAGLIGWRTKETTYKMVPRDKVV